MTSSPSLRGWSRLQACRGVLQTTTTDDRHQWSLLVWPRYTTCRRASNKRLRPTLRTAHTPNAQSELITVLLLWEILLGTWIWGRVGGGGRWNATVLSSLRHTVTVPDAISCLPRVRQADVLDVLTLTDGRGTMHCTTTLLLLVHSLAFTSATWRVDMQPLSLLQLRWSSGCGPSSVCLSVCAGHIVKKLDLEQRAFINNMSFERVTNDQLRGISNSL